MKIMDITKSSPPLEKYFIAFEFSKNDLTVPESIECLYFFSDEDRDDCDYTHWCDMPVHES